MIILNFIFTANPPYKVNFIVRIITRWLGYCDSNTGMSESESDALPLGDTPICFALYHEYFCFSIANKGKRKELHSTQNEVLSFLFY